MVRARKNLRRFTLGQAGILCCEEKRALGKGKIVLKRSAAEKNSTPGWGLRFFQVWARATLLPFNRYEQIRLYASIGAAKVRTREPAGFADGPRLAGLVFARDAAPLARKNLTAAQIGAA